MLQDLRMPARTNEFQQLVRRIYEQLVPAGATVTESAFLTERDSSSSREVDILVEFRLEDTVIRLAVERRDRYRASDIEWIDQLIGKYRDLPVDRVVAVSRTGFTAAATIKACANRIDVRSLKDALEADWPSELRRLGIGRFAMSMCFTRYGMITDPPWGTSPPIAVTVGAGEPVSLTSFFQDIHNQLRPIIADSILEELVRNKTKLTEVPEKLERMARIEPANLVALSDDGMRANVLSLTLWAEVKLVFDEVPVRRQLYGGVGVTSGEIEVPDLGQAFRVTVVQGPGREISNPMVVRSSGETEFK